MTISYNWLLDYLPVTIEPDKLSTILTSLGLEVENLENTFSIKGGLKGLIAGLVLESNPHPDSKKLKVTKIDIGQKDHLQIVCGANNVAQGQKVIVATAGTTIYPMKGDPITIQTTNIRGVTSEGMLCAEDEVGLGNDHAGIIVLPETVKAGSAVSDLYAIQQDWVYEIGLTPNRMDAMSHLGVARDVCAYLTHHKQKEYVPKNPLAGSWKEQTGQPVEVIIENEESCRRYSGISISGITIGPSPEWLQQKLRSIGQRPINNIVDITNFILHETGQPLHAFDADKISGRKILVKNLPAGSSFVTLDEKKRTLDPEDLMICNGEGEPMCFAGVFGGLYSGVTDRTKNIFLESAWFNPIDIRKTSFRHGLRTDAATRFEKNVDISNTVSVLKRAALLVCEIGGGQITSDIIDVYPHEMAKPVVTLKYAFLKKLSGKSYEPSSVKKILSALKFEILEETSEHITVGVPYNKPDITLPADIVEEVMRIDGYDNISIPASITISPALGANFLPGVYKEKTAHYLTGLGFNEIFTNSITNAAYFAGDNLQKGVRLLNNLSAVHNILRPSMLETGLEVIAYNLNRKSLQLQLFEFGKTYQQNDIGKYDESNHLSLFLSGESTENSWKQKGSRLDFFYLKGVLENLFRLTGLKKPVFQKDVSGGNYFTISINHKNIGTMGSVKKARLTTFDIRQPVWFADLEWDKMEEFFSATQISFRELPKQLPVHRDLAMIVSNNLPYGRVQEAIHDIRLNKLHQINLFDIFESDKVGAGKKSIAVSLTFLDEEKTLTDTEIDSMMQSIMKTLEKDLGAEIRKQ
ncbi:MAG TPA: phenylalanine--tRNA ligase subunit beta [Flavitalea sp.]|nr:phenylalanine--tRNA ligase subunit beta [Flavitalea sp.]